VRICGVSPARVLFLGQIDSALTCQPFVLSLVIVDPSPYNVGLIEHRSSHNNSGRWEEVSPSAGRSWAIVFCWRDCGVALVGARARSACPTSLRAAGHLGDSRRLRCGALGHSCRRLGADVRQVCSLLPRATRRLPACDSLCSPLASDALPSLITQAIWIGSGDGGPKVSGRAGACSRRNVRARRGTLYGPISHPCWPSIIQCGSNSC
jgi:hypothetical protein